MDFDGVLHKGSTGTFDRLFLLEGFLRDHPDTSIVITSSWHNADQTYLESLFSPDIRPHIAGRTPFQLGFQPRDAEIQQWITQAQSPQKFIILDDDQSLFPIDKKHLYLTDPKTGLTPKNIDDLESWIQP